MRAKEVKIKKTNNFNIFDLIKSLYTKDLSNIKTEELQTWQLIAVLKWLSYSQESIDIASKSAKLIWYLEPKILYTYLYLIIPKQNKSPYIFKFSKEEVEYNDLEKSIQEILLWTDRELYLHKSILDNVFFPNKQFWRKELGIV